MVYIDWIILLYSVSFYYNNISTVDNNSHIIYIYINIIILCYIIGDRYTYKMCKIKAFYSYKKKKKNRFHLIILIIIP